MEQASARFLRIHYSKGAKLDSWKEVTDYSWKEVKKKLEKEGYQVFGVVWSDGEQVWPKRRKRRA